MVYMQCPHELEIEFPTWIVLELMTSMPNWQDSGLTILSVRVQVPSKLESDWIRKTTLINFKQNKHF